MPTRRLAPFLFVFTIALLSLSTLSASFAAVPDALHSLATEKAGIGTPFLSLIERGEGGVLPLPIRDTFANSWHTYALGMVYNENDDSMLYVHHHYDVNPATIWSIAATGPYTPQASINLSVQNPGLPAALNNRGGAAFDFAVNTFFLSDVGGDQSTRDDNIVEINPSGTIVNAWELDGASNDSSDGSAIEGILDIAIVSGFTNRYFVTNGTNTLYEIALTRAGIWTDNSWSTVGTCTLPADLQASGIDYDRYSARLLVADNNSEILTSVKVDCAEPRQFLCDGPGTFHSGLAVGLLYGLTGRDVWVTDPMSNQTTRCTFGVQLNITVGTDPSTCATTNTITVMVGTHVTYCYTVTNFSPNVYTLHDLADSKLGTILTDFPYSLAPGDSAFVTVTVPMNVTTVNTAKWTSQDTNEYNALHMPEGCTLPNIETLTPLNLTDDGEANITLPFNFTLYQTTSSQLRVGNNGGILVGATTGDIPAVNTALPTNAMPNAILPYWDNIDDEQGNVYHGKWGIEEYVILWHRRPLNEGTPNHDTGTFVVFLRKVNSTNDNGITFCYIDTNFEGTAGDGGGTATIGVNRDNTLADLISFNTQSPHLLGDYSIRYLPASGRASDYATVNVVVPPLTATPTRTATATNSRIYCQSDPLVIPDANPTGASNTLTITHNFLIQDLNVLLFGTHTYVGDLSFRLSDGTTQTTFFDRPGVPASAFGCSGDNLPGMYADDEGGNGSLENNCTNSTPAYTPNGRYTPNSSLSVFDGDSTAGTWTMTASDAVGGDTGTLQQWCLEVIIGGAAATATPTRTPTASVTPGGPTLTPTPTVPTSTPTRTTTPVSTRTPTATITLGVPTSTPTPTPSITPGGPTLTPLPTLTPEIYTLNLPLVHRN
jgi:subtilisin-like proprotein convertase family protein